MILSSGYKNEIILLESSISKILEIDNKACNIELIEDERNFEEINEVNCDNCKDRNNDLDNKFDTINFNEDKDLKYYIIQNIKVITLDIIDKEIKEEISEALIEIIIK